MTNLIASIVVSLVTNSAPLNQPWVTGGAYYLNGTPMEKQDQRILCVEVFRIKTIHFEYEGKTNAVEFSRERISMTTYNQQIQWATTSTNAVKESDSLWMLRGIK